MSGGVESLAAPRTLGLGCCPATASNAVGGVPDVRFYGSGAITSALEALEYPVPMELPRKGGGVGIGFPISNSATTTEPQCRKIDAIKYTLNSLT
jgi:hypothetical protein